MLLCFRVRAFLFSEIRLQPTALSKYITGMSWCYGHISNFVIDDRNFKNSCRYSQEVLTSYRLCFTKLRAKQVLFFTSFCCFDGLRKILYCAANTGISMDSEKLLLHVCALQNFFTKPFAWRVLFLAKHFALQSIFHAKPFALESFAEWRFDFLPGKVL